MTEGCRLGGELKAHVIAVLLLDLLIGQFLDWVWSGPREGPGEECRGVA